jgi:hypothetical protein
MHFLLAANAKHKSFVVQCLNSLNALAYHWTIFDLGGLGFGRPFPIEDETFNQHGYYKTTYTKRRSIGLHKPQVIAEFLNQKSNREDGDLVVYLDADTFVRGRIDEIMGQYDIGVTVRQPSEWVQEGKINAGVIFFRRTLFTKLFLDRWILQTRLLGNDQEALNSLLLSPTCTVAEFPTSVYNWYYFPTKPPAEVKILHFKSSSREHNELYLKAWNSACSSDYNSTIRVDSQQPICKKR